MLSLKSENSSLTNRSTREDFPTADSPGEPNQFECRELVERRWEEGGGWRDVGAIPSRGEVVVQVAPGSRVE